ncbi:MAG: hypothetical protein QGH59_00785 [Gemmatimonadota bacterium]|nr:hypothetical protein [Gemmatimonadota bacterium]
MPKIRAVRRHRLENRAVGIAGRDRRVDKRETIDVDAATWAKIQETHPGMWEVIDGWKPAEPKAKAKPKAKKKGAKR